ncbi:alpha/beta fold hydrolase [Jatrophihabitans sp. DSM 45814]
MAPGLADANGIVLAYETFGDPSDPPLLLVMGLSTQMLGWPEAFCKQLAAEGFYVIRFDNRDSGLSTHLDDLSVPNPVAVALRRRQPAYTLDDLAADTLGLMDALGLDGVNLVGASMGGFIAQLVALSEPNRIASLTLVMTSTGSRRVGRTAPKVLSSVLRRKPAPDREAAIAASVEMFAMIGSPAYALAEADVAEFAAQSYDRAYDPAGQRRQLAAVMAQSDRTVDLSRIAVPTVVMHGLHDPLVGPSGGIALAKAIPGARFVGFNGMGHDLPAVLWPDFINEIVRISGRHKS